MKVTQKKILLLLLLILLGGCGGNNSDNNQISNPSSSESINGTYVYRDPSLKVDITVTGSTWIGKWVFISGFGSDYDNENAEYENGQVVDSDLYDSSGYVKIGYVSGTNLTIPFHDQMITLKKR